MLKIAVVDDEIVFVESLINKITAVREKLNLEFKIDKYSNGFDILENYSKYHLIFLDIEMPSIDGIATAKRINELKGSAEIPFIVYVTSHDELVFDALKSFPYSFIRKSKIESDLYECINRINNSFEELHKTIVLHTERKDIPIVIGDIIYLEKIKNYVVFKNIAEYGFIRPHIGYAVNNKYVEYISADCILLQNDINIPLNKKYRDDLKKKYFKWLGDINV